MHFPLYKYKDLLFTQPSHVAQCLPRACSVITMTGREDQAKSVLLWGWMGTQTQQAQGQSAQPFHDANIPVNHYYKIQEVGGTV